MSFLCPRVCDNKNEFGYCQTTWCINPQFSNIGTAQYGQGAQKVVVTNADRIRAMSDEELADFLYHTDGDVMVQDEWFWWLKTEVTE